MARFTDTHAVVTGGTSGIGRATALRLADEGATVLVTGRDADRLDEMSATDGIVAVPNDAAETDTGTALRTAVEEHLDGRVDALFLNAGLGAFAPVADTAAELVDLQHDVNVRGPMLQLAALEPTLSDGAAVVFNTSIVNDVGMPASMAYAASKGAVRSAMRVAASELAARGIRVNAVSPGPIDTSFFANTNLDEASVQEMAGQIQSSVPLGRFGSPEEIAAATTFLLSDDASFVTGAELRVDGGMA